MKNIKSYLTGAVSMLLCVLLISTVLGTQASKTIPAVYRDIKITIDGKQIEPKDANGNIVEPFISDGTTYLPVKAVSEAVGYDVSWDDPSSTVSLKKKGTSANTSGYSRTSPAPVGTAQTITIESYDYDFTVTVKINSVVSGDEAWKLIQDYYNRADPAPDVKMYILANITATVDNISSDRAIDLNYNWFDVFSSSNVEYKRGYPTVPEPVFNSQVFEGGTHTGNGVFIVDKTDASPKAVFGMNYDGSGGIWFSLK